MVGELTRDAELEADRLDKMYREEGWGLITDKAFGGRLRPQDVESQARDVARRAYESEKAHIARENAMGTELEQKDRDLANLQRIADAHARLVPRYDGTRAALRLLRVSEARARVDAARAKHEAAGLALKVAEAELVLREAASRRGDDQMPTSIEKRVLTEWLDEHRSDEDEPS